MSSFINKVKKRLSLSGPSRSSTSPPATEGAVAAPPADDAAAPAIPTTTNQTSTVTAVADGEPKTEPVAFESTAFEPTSVAPNTIAEDEVAPDAPAPLAAPRRSQDYGLDASKHKPSAFTQKLGAAEIAHEKGDSHQRRHGSISGYEHYGAGNH